MDEPVNTTLPPPGWLRDLAAVVQENQEVETEMAGRDMDHADLIDDMALLGTLIEGAVTSFEIYKNGDSSLTDMIDAILEDTDRIKMMLDAVSRRAGDIGLYEL